MNHNTPVKDWILWRLRTPIARVIVWYLRSVAGEFHCFPYGSQGRYVVLMKDHEAERFNRERDQWGYDWALKNYMDEQIKAVTAPTKKGES